MSLGIRDFMPGADSNFGIPKGKGCLPFLSEFMQAAYGNCQQVADERAFDAWGTELRSAILTGQIDILKARYLFIFWVTCFVLAKRHVVAEPNDNNAHL